jgi:hypothetical protein
MKANGSAEFAAGASIGSLLGLIMGLSVSPVVHTVLGALAAGLLALLGIRGKAHNDIAGSQGSTVLRIFGFGSFCTIFLLLGIFFRTHDTLAPSLRSQQEKLAAPGLLNQDEIHQIILLKAFGLSSTGKGGDTTALQPVNERNIAGAGAAVLFASQAQVCNVLRRDQYSNLSAYLDALRSHGGDYSSLATVVANQKPEDQEQLATTLSNLLCK